MVFASMHDEVDDGDVKASFQEAYGRLLELCLEYDFPFYCDCTV